MKMKKHLTSICFALLCCFLQNTLNAQPSHITFTNLLQKHVNSNGFVDYNSLKKNELQLDAYLTILERNIPNPNWSVDQKKAYLINTYNAYTLKLILINYPLESIRDIGNLLQTPFNMKFIPFDGKMISLDDVEKGMLLKMGDPRVHFAVNCASKSCPKLQNKAFEAKTLNAQLENVTKEFILSDENKIQSNQLMLSKLFKWYASDFEHVSGSVQAFINKYTSVKIKPNASISYKDYSSALNGK